jgi:ribosomal protein L11 methyltransferase
MKYLELTFHITPYNEAAADVLTALLADVGCDTFLPSDTGLTAYILQDAYDEVAIRDAVSSTLALFPVTVPEGLRITFTAAPAPDENWNATWEAEHHFEPITLPDGQLLQIIPRQAFGSGEHATTRLMLGLLSDLAPLADTTVIDAGCGTGILGIAALKLGAAHVFAYDIDEWSVRNAQDNYALNGCEAEIALGDASCLAAAPQADILLANINRNILLADLPAFASHLKPAGHLLLSGFYEADIPVLTAAATPLGLTLCDTRSDGDWRALHFISEK